MLLTNLKGSPIIFRDNTESVGTNEIYSLETRKRFLFRPLFNLVLCFCVEGFMYKLLKLEKFRLQPRYQTP